jgi:hypothetical protein
MDALPDDLILKILHRVNPPTLVIIGSLSKRFRIIALHPRVSLAVTDARINAGMGAWIKTNAMRIRALSAARCTFGPGCLEWARDVPLASLKVLYGRVAPSALECICANSLKLLVVHQIAPDIHHERVHPNIFQRFTRLRTLDITFSSWDYTEIVGLDALQRLKHLGLRNANILEIACPFPPNLETVVLKALHIMVIHHPLPVTCRSVSLECGSILPMEDVLGRTRVYPHLHNLNIVSPLTMRLRCISRMPSLETMSCQCQMFIFGQDEWIAAAKSVRVANVHASLAMCTDLYDYDQVVRITESIETMHGTQHGISFDIKAFLLGMFV